MDEEKDFQKIFDHIKELLEVYEPEMKVLSDYGSRYELAAKGEYEVTSERTGKTTVKKEPFFSGIIIQSSYVGFYNSGVYVEPGRFKGKHEALIDKTLKGKSCFHIKVFNDEVKDMIESVLKETYDLFKDNGWLEA